MKPNSRLWAPLAGLGLGAGMVIPSGMLTRETERQDLMYKCKFVGLCPSGNESIEELRTMYNRATMMQQQRPSAAKLTTVIRELFVKFEPKSQDERRKERNKRKAARRGKR